MFSLAGIPPLAGFFGKFHLFFSGASTGHYTLVAFAVLNNVIALFYYLQLIKAAWVDEPDGHLNPLRLTKRQREVIILLSIAVIFLGFVPFLSNNIFAGFTL
jgi:NADH-quinone oxidoreductase subunit N